MVSISKNLLLNANGDGIGILQDSLSKIGFIIDSKEKTKKIFGKTTKKAVRKFQSDNGLQINGIVDDKTADKIIKLIQQNGPQAQKSISKSHLENVMIPETNSKTIKVPRSLLESEVFFKSLEDSMNKLKKEETVYINQKLNNYLQHDLLLRLIGDEINENLLIGLKNQIAKLDYTKYIEFTLLQTVNQVLIDLQNIDSSLKQHISKIKELLFSQSSVFAPISKFADQKIGVLLDLKTPLNDNRIFRDELKIEKTRYYISLTSLKASVGEKILESKIDFSQFPHDILLDLVKSKVISEKEAHSLKNIASLARITGDNPKFVRLLTSKNTKSVVDLISWEEDDWKNFIVKQKIPLPTNVTSTKIYFENIKSNLERWYPTQILLNRASDSSIVSAADSNLIDSVNKLLRTNDKLIESGNISIVNWKGISRTQKAEIEKSLHQLILFSNFYKHIGIQDILNNKKMSISKKKSAIKTATNQIRTFNINNPELDLRLLNFFDNKEMQKLEWNGISTSYKNKIRKQMMAYQRVLTITDRTSEHAVLMTKGYDSALSIAKTTQHEFETACGIEPDRGRIVYFKAQQQILHTAHNFEAIRDVTHGDFQHIRVSNVNPSLVNDLRQIDGFEKLFGPQNYCACQDCMSILSPAAYFVDLMRFIHDNISKNTFVDTDLETHPLYLKNRRNDLWQMHINCENTFTLVPYLDIVNEVLQAYLERVLPRLGGDFFKILSDDSPDTKISFSLPFNLRFEEIEMYLGHFGLSLYDFYKIFPQQTSDETDKKIWRSKLGLTKEQLEVIVKPDSINVQFRYGNPPSFSAFPVLDFLKSTGLTRPQVDELLQIRFQNLKNIVIEKIIDDPDEIQNFKEVLNNLDNKKLDFIHRFIQLMRRTKWSLPELDMILMALYNSKIIEKSKINTTAVINIAKLFSIKETLKLDVEELCCMVDRLPLSASYPNPPLNEKNKKFFECIFDVNSLFEDPLRRNPETHSIDPFTSFHHYSFNKKNKDDTKVDPKMPILLSGLGITESELILLFKVLNQKIKFDRTNGNCKLGLRKISLLYRYVRLARALKFNSIKDFVTAISVCFNVLPNTEPDFVIDSIDHIFQLMKFKNWAESSPFDINELCMILFGQQNDVIQFETTIEIVIAMVKKINQDAENSTEPNKIKKKIELLKAAISTLLNISLDHENRIFHWVKTQVEDDKIKAALNTKFDDDGNPIPINSLDPLLKMIHELERVMLLFSNLKFTEKTVDKIDKQKDHLGITDLKNLTFENLQSLTKYHKILDSMIEDTQERDSDKNIGTLLDDYDKHHKFSEQSTVFLSTIWNKDKEILESISKLTLLQHVPVTIDAVYLLWKLSNICQTLGINGSLLRKIANDETYEDLSIASDIVLGLFSSKYEDQKVRQQKLEPYQEVINKRKNDAFCDYILSLKKDLKFNNRNDIFSFFLLDPEMGGCAKISRIVSAISSLQLYVHRCLVNLEQSDLDLNPEIPDIHVNPASIPHDQWEWRKNYRLWEANRKVFLYPENYLEPDLRDNKTPQFIELEDELLQKKITKESAEDAYRKYVSQYAELARLVISGASLDIMEGETYLFLFGRTALQPYEYYYRKMHWYRLDANPWKKIDLTINSDKVSSIVHLGRLYIFWVETIKKSKITVLNGGTSDELRWNHYLHYSILNESGKWSPPQKLLLELEYVNPPIVDGTDETERTCFVYPLINDGKIYISYSRCKIQGDGSHQGVTVEKYEVLYLNLFKNTLTTLGPGERERLGKVPIGIEWVRIALFIDTFLTTEAFPGGEFNLIHEAVVQAALQYTAHSADINHRMSTDIIQFEPKLALIRNAPGNLILNLGNQQFLIRYSQLDTWITRSTLRLNTSLQDKLGEILFNQGIEKFLSLETQKEPEQRIADPFPFNVRFFLPRPPEYLESPHESEIDPFYHFSRYGTYSEYYRELFFHIPFLIAHFLNANQKFKEAKWWYERIFDISASESPTDSTLETDRNWRYIEFRRTGIEKMRTILTNDNAISEYKDNPFNPHAIARLRFSAYKKTIVMKYIDNLIDWADHLFAEDSIESINEASMLYILASDILGEKPVKLGNCDIAMEEPQNLTYQIIEEKGKFDGEFNSEFLITLQNWHHLNNVRDLIIPENDIFKNKPEAGYYDAIMSNKKSLESIVIAPEVISLGKQNLSHLLDVTTKVSADSTLLFCIPENKDLLNYWLRVQDRLFKIRNCMNISGVRRNLALFQPPIDPMLLIKAKAAGLTIEDIIKSDNPSSYRFTYIIEKAKQFAQTVQNFGSVLLAALEKKDNEELILLRSVHERHILNNMQAVKKKQLEDAIAQYQATVAARSSVQMRVDYYTSLLEGGLFATEIMQEKMRFDATNKIGFAASLRVVASMFYLTPQIGSPFAMKWGGKELGDSMNAYAEFVESQSRMMQGISESSGTRANFGRREQEWEQQLKLATQELKQMDNQVLASDIKVKIAEKEIDIHNKNIEQANELDEFYKGKFTNLGLYNYLCTSMSRLYREAYNVAYDMALMAERAYKFEQDDQTESLIRSDNWQFDRAGLLAGERLILQLQELEKKFIEKNVRQNEITQSFSLALLNPSALTLLKENAGCEFTLPEILFNLVYPGQYKRIIKSVQITIPCVTGPYTNISAKLSLITSKIRYDKDAVIPDIDIDNIDFLTDIPRKPISTSSAYNDTGMFEFSFRDERYLPFEGAGAVESRWKLELPSSFRSFDYNTISDVILRISYTAEEKEDGGLYRDEIEKKIKDGLKELASNSGLSRLISLKHDFPSAFNKLLNPSEGERQVTEFLISKNYFPYFLSKENLMLKSPTVMYLKPKQGKEVDTKNLKTLKINDKELAEDWKPNDKIEYFQESSVNLSGKPDGLWTLKARKDGFNKEDLDDILILINYKIQ